MPKVYLIADSGLNAFATGRDPQHAHIAVTTGLLEVLEDEELEGVLAHELSHIGNYDIRWMAIVMVLVSIISVVSDFFFHFSFFGSRDERENSNGALLVVGIAMAVLAPLVATIVQLAVSRRREYLADASGALLTRYPQGLAGALAKIGSSHRVQHRATTATEHLYFASPFRGKGRFLANLFSTHPPIEERIKRLREMEVHA